MKRGFPKKWAKHFKTNKQTLKPTRKGANVFVNFPHRRATKHHQVCEPFKGQPRGSLSSLGKLGGIRLGPMTEKSLKLSLISTERSCLRLDFVFEGGAESLSKK